MDRQAIATEHWKTLFYEQGWDKNYEYIRFEDRHKIRVKCKKCGCEQVRTTSFLTGKQERLVCVECKNGSILYSPFVDEVLEYYSQGHSVQETCIKFEVKSTKLSNWAKHRGVTNGRSLSDINQEKSLIAARLNMERAEGRLKMELLPKGFDVVRYDGIDAPVLLRCVSCGCEFTRNIHTMRQKGIRCPACAKRLRDEEKIKQQQAYREILAQRKLEREMAARARQKEAEEERNKVLDAIHTCTMCGKNYTIRSYMKDIGARYARDSGYCSSFCRDQHIKQNQRLANKKYRKNRVSDNHYHRAKKLGLPAEH